MRVAVRDLPPATDFATLSTWLVLNSEASCTSCKAQLQFAQAAGQALGLAMPNAGGLKTVCSLLSVMSPSTMYPTMLQSALLHPVYCVLRGCCLHCVTL